MPASLFWLQVWQLAVLIALIAFLNRTLARNRPHLAHALWLVVLVKSLTPPVWSSPGGLFCWLQPAQIIAPPETSPMAARWQVLTEAGRNIAEQDSMSGAVDPEPWPVAEAVPFPDDDAWSDSWLSRRLRTATPSDWLMAGWLSGSLLAFGVLLLRWLRLWREIRRAPRRNVPEVEALLTSLARQLGLKRRVRLLVTESRIGPAVIGIFRITVLLPAALVERLAAGSSSCSPDAGSLTDRMTPVLAHELLHVRRGDLWTGLLQSVAQSLWWCHPLLWWAGRMTRREAERCCDEEVLAELRCDPARYARSLVDVLELKRDLRTVPVFPGVKPLEVTSERLERIMRTGQGCHRRTPWWCWLIAGLAASLTWPGAAFIVSAEPPRDLPVLPAPNVATQVPPVATPGQVQTPSAVSPVTGQGVSSDAGLTGRIVLAEPSDSSAMNPEVPSQQSAAKPILQWSGGSVLVRDGLWELQIETGTGAPPQSLRHDATTIEIAQPVQLRIRQATAPDRLTDGAGAIARADRLSLTSGSDQSLRVMLQGHVMIRTSAETEATVHAETMTLHLPAERSQMGTAERDVRVDFTDVREMTLRTATETRRLSSDRISLTLSSDLRRVLRVDASQGDYSQTRAEQSDAVMKPVSLSLVDQPLTDALPQLRAATGLNVVLDGRGLAEEGAKPDSTVSLEVQGISLRSALKLLLEPLGLSWRLDEDTIVITSRQRAEGGLQVRVYAVADLVVPVAKRVTWNFTAAGLDPVPEAAGRPWRAIGTPDGKAVDADAPQVPAPPAAKVTPPQPELDPAGFEPLIDLVRHTVRPDDWDLAGGSGSIRVNHSTLSLVVRQTLAVHAEIRQLFEQLRRLQDIQVVLQSIPLVVPDAFLERAGLTFQPVPGHASLRSCLLTEREAALLQASWPPQSVPKITLFNGQQLEMLFGEPDAAPVRLALHPAASSDLRQLRLSYGLRASATELASESLATVTMSNGQSLLLDATGTLLPAQIRSMPAVLRNLPETSHLFQSPPKPGERTLLLITGRVIDAAESDPFQAEAEPHSRPEQR